MRNFFFSGLPSYDSRCSHSAWLHAKDLSALKRHEIEAFLADESKKRNGDLREGYRIALDPQPWMTNRAEIQQAEIEAAENEQVDQLESENEGDEDSEAKKKSKKRKREDDPTKPAKKAPKPKKGSAEPASKKKSASAAGKPKKNGAKSKTMVESEDEGDAAGAEDDEDAGPSKKKASPPPAKKVKRDKDEDGDEGSFSISPIQLLTLVSGILCQRATIPASYISYLPHLSLFHRF